MGEVKEMFEWREGGREGRRIFITIPEVTAVFWLLDYLIFPPIFSIGHFDSFS